METLLKCTDIDYMHEKYVFTLGIQFPLDKMRKFINDLHAKDQHYIVMVDPGNCLDPVHRLN